MEREKIKESKGSGATHDDDDDDDDDDVMKTPFSFHANDNDDSDDDDDADDDINKKGKDNEEGINEKKQKFDNKSKSCNDKNNDNGAIGDATATKQQHQQQSSSTLQKSNATFAKCTKHSLSSFFSKSKGRYKNNEMISLRLPASLLLAHLSSSSKEEEEQPKLILHCSKIHQQQQHQQQSRCVLKIINEKNNQNNNEENKTAPSKQTTYPLTTIHPHCTTQTFRIASSKPLQQQQQQQQQSHYCKHLGTIHSHYEIQPPPTTTITKINLKKMGQKTRQSLLQSKLKQKKVLRIENDEHYSPSTKQRKEEESKEEEEATKKNKVSMFATSIRDTAKKQQVKKRGKRKSADNNTTTNTKQAVKRKLSITSPAPKKDTVASVSAANLNTVNKSSVQQPSHTTANNNNKKQQDNHHQSTILRLHNIPFATVQPQQIRKFFTGLDLDRIFILPTHSSFVPYLDSPYHDSHDIDDDDDDEKEEERFIRVYVKFASVTACKLALERHGEILSFGKDEEESVAGGDGGNVAVYMSCVPKFIATFLSRYMAIDGVKGKPLMDTLHQTEKRLPKVVLDTLWVMTKSTLERQIKHVDNDIGDDDDTENSNDYDNNNDNKNDDGDNDWIPTNKESYKSSIQRYNELWNIHEHLELDCCDMTLNSSSSPKKPMMMMMMHEWDPSNQTTNNDPVQRLTVSVSDWLLDEMERIDSRLRIAEHFLLWRGVDG